MAKNLQSKLQPCDRISIFDVNPQSMQGLETEMKAASQGAAVELAASTFDASKDAVSTDLLPSTLSPPNDEQYCSIYDLSWGQSLDSSGSPVIITIIANPLKFEHTLSVLAASYGKFRD